MPKKSTNLKIRKKGGILTDAAFLFDTGEDIVYNLLWRIDEK